MKSSSSVKFLLVDDLEENLLALEGLLRRDGLDLVKAKSGPQALELLLANDFGLAILDVHMPGMNGFELAELMRGSSITQHVPIIFLTAAASDDRRRFRGYEAGAVDFLFKPIEPTVLQGKAEVFFDLFIQRQEVMRQRDQLRAAAEENARLFREILGLNDSLEQRVQDRTIQLLETTEQLTGFTNSIAHDFRQHIRTVNINAQIVLEEAVNSIGPHQTNLERIHEAAMLMNQMTDDLLVYAKTRTASIMPVEIDVTALAKEIATASNSSYPRARFSVGEGMTVNADRTMFRIVLENLLDNAFKYSQNVDEPFIEIGEDEEGLFVRDNGVGFDMSFVEKLFLPFERLHGKSEFPGTGLGLANVKRILDKHEGRIWVQAAPGKGATFHVSLGSKLEE